MFSLLTRLLCLTVILSFVSWVCVANPGFLVDFVSNKVSRLAETVEATPMIIESRLSSLAREKKWV